MQTATEYWMDELVSRSAGTKERYSRYFSEFCRFTGMGADELLKQRKADLKADDIREQRRMETLLKKFIANMAEEGFSTSTQQVAYAAVRSFFDQNFTPLAMRRGDYPTGENFGHRAITKEEILKMVEIAQPDKRAEILILKDSGLRASDIVSLKVDDLEPGLSRGDEFIQIRIITKKNRVAARAFIGPEATRAIREYLDLRRKGTRFMPKEEVTGKSPLFKAHLSKDVHALTREGLSSSMAWLAAKIGAGGDVSAHSFRKFFQTRMESAGVNPNWIDHMIGHKLPGVGNHYSLPTEEELLETYKKAYNELRVYERKEDETETLRRQVEQLQARLDSITETRRESDNVMDRLFEDPKFKAMLARKLKEIKI